MKSLSYMNLNTVAKKYLPFSTQRCTAAYVYLNELNVFFFPSQYCPLYIQQNQKWNARPGTDSAEVKPYTDYDQYKSYNSDIQSKDFSAPPVQGVHAHDNDTYARGRKNAINLVSKDFRKNNRPTSNDRLNHDG